MQSRESIPRRDQASKVDVCNNLTFTLSNNFPREVYRMVRHHTQWGDLVPLIETVSTIILVYCVQ